MRSADLSARGVGSRDEERMVYTEAAKRLRNEREVRWAAEGKISAPRFRCECSRPDCDLLLTISDREWQEVRSRPNRFAVAPWHAARPFDATVEEYPNFSLIEKQGRAGVLAAELA